MLNYVRMRSLTRGAERLSGERPSFNFTFALGHDPPPGDPLDPCALHHQPLDRDTLELFRGELMAADPRLGRTREPCWLLLSCGVVMRSHVCRADGSDFMDFAEVECVIPELVTRFSRERARVAWRQLVADLRTLGVAPVPGEPVASAFTRRCTISSYNLFLPETQLKRAPPSGGRNVGKGVGEDGRWKMAIHNNRNSRSTMVAWVG